MKNRVTAVMLLVAMAILVAIPMELRAQKRQTSIKELPQPAITFLTKNFDVTKISKCMIGENRKSFEVYFTGGTEVDFDKAGRWEEIENEKIPINSLIKGIIPESISKYIEENYPGVSVSKIENNRKNYEVTLKTSPKKTELDFNKDGKFLKKSVDK